MNRRESLALLVASVAGGPTIVEAQAPATNRPLRIGLVPDFGPGFWANHLKILTEVLTEAGKAEGRDFVYLHSGVYYGPDTDLALERVLDHKPDLMVTGNLGYAVAARRRTTTIPVVMFIAGFPVEGGIAESLSRPGGNVTGTVNYAGGEVFGKLVELLHETKPSVRRIGALMTYVPPFHPRAETEVINRGMRDASHALKLDLRIEEASNPEQIDAALESFSRQQVEALVLTGDTSTIPRRKDIVRYAIERRLPAIIDAAWTDVVDPRPLLVYRPDWAVMMRQAARYVHKILWRGAKPAELPIQLPERFVFSVNLKTARAIGVTVPRSILARADEVIE